MSTREFLQKLTAKSNLELTYTEEIIEFSKVILQNWKTNCVHFASEGKSAAPLYSFTMDKTYNEIRIAHMIERGLLDILKRETEMDITFHKYIVNIDGKIVKCLVNDFDIDISTIDQEKKIIAYIGVIQASW